MVKITLQDDSYMMFDSYKDIGSHVICVEKGHEDIFVPKEKIKEIVKCKN